ncbi:hypothetical protein MNBD_GAMMA24-1203 [hydrothermal vent metagenome]|uniref:Permease n=1 Tax=hydrothermal vent metagenome TaxID=652676 RepID=A0A3B1C617_9ZZZZ
MSSEYENNENKKTRKKQGGWWFLLITVIFYGILFFYKPELTQGALSHFVTLLKDIAPILIVVMLFMWLLDVLINPRQIQNILGNKSGIRGWIISIIGGILSHGPVYAWYPLLENLQKQGTRPAYIATFLYARSIKLPWLPMLAYYFGTTYMLLFTFFLVLFSPVVGWITERSYLRQ